jgi:hypothetical protein
LLNSSVSTNINNNSNVISITHEQAIEKINADNSLTHEQAEEIKTKLDEIQKILNEKITKKEK